MARLKPYSIHFRYQKPTLGSIARFVWQTPRRLYRAWLYRQFENRFGGIRVRQAYYLSNLTLAENATPGKDYEPSDLPALTRVFRHLDLPRDCGFVDYGCGLGGVLIAASEYGFHRVTGVEVALEFQQIAVENIRRYTHHLSPETEITALHLDATSYEVKDSDAVFHFFKPFGAGALVRVLDNIAESTRRTPRRIWVLYNNPDADDLNALNGHRLLAGGDLIEQRIHCFESYDAGRLRHRS